MGAARVASFAPARLRELRTKAGLTLTDLAELIPVTPGWRKSDIWRYENGLRVPSPTALTLLAGALAVPAIELTTAGHAPDLVDLRQVAGLTRAKAAAELGLTVDQLIHLERGRGNIGKYTFRLAGLLGVTEQLVLAAHSRCAARSSAA